jgi:putative CocE/NonD family hydrolase
MRDGVVLKADVYSPVGDGPWPTLVIRTPYGKSSVTENAWNGVSPTEAARRGFMVIIQDVRGRNASDGVWEPFHHEGRDGAETIAWAAELPGSSGRVGMVGGSYCGNTQWQAAIEQPPALQVITPLMTWSEPCDGLVARAGAVQLSNNCAWALAMGFDWLTRLGLTDDEVAERAGVLMSDIDRLMEDGLWGLPVSELPVLRRHAPPGFVKLGAENSVAATQHLRVAGGYERVEIPSMHTAG